MKKRISLLVISITLLIGLAYGVTSVDANYELFDPYPIKIEPVGEHAYYRHGDTIELLVEFSIPVSCDQSMPTTSILQFIDVEGNHIHLEWDWGEEESQYFKLKLTDEKDGVYSLDDFYLYVCEHQGTRGVFSGEYLQTLFSDIVIDNVAPEITGATITTDTTHQIVFNVGETIEFEVTFNEAISHPEGLSILLNNGGVAHYKGKTNDHTLQFSYVVQADRDIGKLDTVQLQGPLQDLAGNKTATAAKNMTISSNPGIIIDTKPPVINVDLPSTSHYARTHDIVLQVADRDNEPKLFHLWNQSPTTPSSGAINESGAANGQLLPQPGSVNGDYYIHIRAHDDVNNEAIVTFGPYKFDNESPTATFSKAPQSSSEVLNIRITGSDNLSGVKEIAYRWAGEGDYLITDQSSVDVTTPNADGTYTLEVIVTDEVGNTRSYSHGPFMIDVTPPEVAFSKQGDATPSQIHAVDMTVTDSYALDAQVFVQWTTDAAYPGDESSAWQLIYAGDLPLETTVTSPPDADGSLHLHVKAIDGLGHIARQSTTGSFIVDNTPPAVEFIPNGNNGIYAPTANVQLQIDGSTTGLSGYKILYAISPEATIDESTADWLMSDDGALSITERSGKYYIHALVTDEAGNRTITASQPFAVDHLPPTGSVNFAKQYTNETDILVNLWAQDNIADSLIDMKYSLNAGPWSEWMSYTQHLQVNLDPSTEGTQSIAVKYRDSAGNESSEYTAETVYDISSPTVLGVTFNPPATIWTNDSVEVVLSYEDNLSPDSSVSQTFTDNGSYMIEFFDLAGNKGTHEITIANIDKVKPQLQFYPDGASVAQQAVSSTITATDNVSSGSDLLVYYGWSPSPTQEPIDWTEHFDMEQGVHLADVNGHWYLWAKAIDEAGNEQIQRSASFLLDNQPPTGLITYDPPTRTANDVTARITFDEEVTILHPADGSAEIIFTENGEFTFEFVDVAGNQAEAIAIVDWIDDSLPSAQVIRAPSSWTNEDVEVTIRVDGDPPRHLTDIIAPQDSELIRIITEEYGELTSWPVEDDVTVTEVVYLLTQNGEITYTIVDLETGMTNPDERVVIDYIDRVAPTANLSFSHMTWTNEDVIVTLHATDDRTHVTVLGESTHRFTSNGSHTFHFRDEAGNWAEQTATVDFIDKEIPNPVVTFDHSTWTTEAVTASITFDNETEPVQILNHDGKSTYTFEENGEVTVHYRDIAGNVGQTTIVVDWIDREAPTGYLTYSTTDWTNEDVTVTLHVQDNSGEPVIFIAQGNEGGNQHTFTENGEFTFIVMDLAGNQSAFTASVQRIDKTPPQADVYYSTTSPTNAAVQVTISADELVTVSNNGGRTFYNFTNNGEFTFIITDRAGNITHVHTEVDWIDRTPPTAQVTYSNTKPTNQPVIATVTANEPFYVQNNNRSHQYVFTENGSFTFYIQDLAGNVTEIVASVDNINASPAQIELVYSEEEPTTSHVTVEMVSDRPLTIHNNGGSPIVTFQQNGVFRLEATDELGQPYVIPIEVDHIDRIHPQIYFEQGAQLLIKQGETVEPLEGVVAFDNLDGDMTDKLHVIHDIDSSRPGEYTLIYRAQDRAGNETVVERKALVLETDELIVFVNGQTPTADGITLRASELSLQIFAERGDVTVRWSEGKRYLGDFKTNQALLTEPVLKIERQNYYTFLIEDQERQYKLIHVYVIPTY